MYDLVVGGTLNQSSLTHDMTELLLKKDVKLQVIHISTLTTAVFCLLENRL